jgi:hypothetical protein
VPDDCRAHCCPTAGLWVNLTNRISPSPRDMWHECTQAVYEDDEQVHIITEYCAGGELSFAISQRHYSERTVASYMRAVLRTLAQCHAHHILHRDIKVCGARMLCVCCVCARVCNHARPVAPLISAATSMCVVQCCLPVAACHSIPGCCVFP